MADFKRAFDQEFAKYKRHVAGEFDRTSLEGEYWREIMRQNAVKFGNRVKKETGVYPAGFDQVSRRRRR